jgi:hypothetical protein
MKYLLFGCLLFIIACSTSNDNKSLEGVYVGHFEHEYGINDDTLIIKKANDGENIFQLTRHTGTIRKQDGKEFTKKQSLENLVLEYDATTKVLKDLKEGRFLIWDSKNSTLKLGNTQYKKQSN